MIKKLKSYLPLLLIFILFSCLTSCSLTFRLEDYFADDFAKDYSPASEAKTTEVKKLIESSNNTKCSIASSIKISSTLSSKSFEQVLLSDNNKYRVTWFAPNYIQTMAYYIEVLDKNKNEKLYCDLTLNTCWQSLPKDSDLEVLKDILFFEGINLRNLILGNISSLKYFKTIDTFVNNKNENSFLIRASDESYKLSIKANKVSNSLLLEKLYIEKGLDRIAELYWTYETDKIPTKLRLELVEKGITIELNLKKYNLSPDLKNTGIFSLTPPDGFDLN